MNSRKLQDRLYFGLGVSARQVGQPADAFRAAGPFRPLARENRYLRLPVWFSSLKGGGRRPNLYGEVLWQGVFDASYTRPGDYLVSPHGTFFVASQEPMLPVLCVRTNRVLSIVRPSMQTNPAGNPYGGYSPGAAVALMEAWPASVLGESRSNSSIADLPTDQGTPYWNVLLPLTGQVTLSPGDFITDDLNRKAIITNSELTGLGWRVIAKMATT